MPVEAAPITPITETTLAIEGMNCASCVSHVQKAIENVAGVQRAAVNLAAGRAVVSYDAATTNPSRFADAVRQAGYAARPAESIGQGKNEHASTNHARQWLNRAVVGFALWLPLETTHWILHLSGNMRWHVAMAWISLIAATIAIMYVGAAFYRSAFGALRRGTSNMDTLIALGASVAYVYSLVAFAGFEARWWPVLPVLYFMESAGLLALISLGHYLEARARQSAGSAIRQLLELAPATALRLAREGADTSYSAVPVSSLRIGDLVLIRPGDRVPIDGVVVDGVSSVDESMISGEPAPVVRKAGDEVIGGTQNSEGRLIVRVGKVGAQTALAQIVRLVETAQASKPPIQQLADRVSAVFVPTILIIALATGIGWYAWGGVHQWQAMRTWGALANAVCSVLIIACPCALGLALPAAIMVGTGIGARRGILIRDIDALQHAERIQTLALDKTGTLTHGKPAVAAIEGGNAEEILRLAAAAEEYSEHPAAKAIVTEARKRGIQWDSAEEFTSQPGEGVVARIDGDQILAGNAALLSRHGLDINAVNHTPSAGTPGEVRGGGLSVFSVQSSALKSDPHPNPPPEYQGRGFESSGTVVFIARKADAGFDLLGKIILQDAIKNDSPAAIAALHSMNLKTVLLTGDNAAAAKSVAQQVGITDIHADVRPGQKADVIRQLQAAGRIVAMVGDGINDAPALAQANLGIAMGGGSDIAKETGGIVLVGGSVMEVAAAIRLSKSTMRIIRQNLFLAFAYNVLAVPLAAFGLLNPLIAAAAMALSDISVIGNALRLRWKKLD